jgi:hypothetical protein
MKHFFDGGIVEFSDTAVVRNRHGEWFNPFMHYSYVARVKFDDDYVVIVTLFPGAATRRQGEYVKPVAQAAIHAKSHGDNLAEVTAS